MTHSELKAKALKKKNVRIAYESLEPGFSLLGKLLKAGLSQAEIAIRMGTKASAITRLEQNHW